MATISLSSPKQPYSNGKYKPVAFDFWGAPILQNPDGTLFCPGFYMQGDVYGQTANAYSANAYDTVLIGVQQPFAQPNRKPQTPGIATVTVTSKGRQIDMHKSAGGDGERAIWHGLMCGRVQIAIKIWTPEQLKQLRLLWADISPLADKKDPLAFSCTHPVLKDYGITALQFEKMEGPVDGPQPRSKIYTLHSVEFLPPGNKDRTKHDEKPLPTKFDANKNAPSTPGKDPKNTGPT